MDLVKYELPVPKESKEIVDSVSAIIEHFMSGKSLDAAAVLLPSVMAAVDGYQKVADEVKSDYNDEAAGYTVHKIFSALKVKKA